MIGLLKILMLSMASTVLTQQSARDDVICGAHRAASCKECPQGNGPTWCNGQCSWCKITNQCQSKEEKCLNVICGAHRAASCKECPQGNGPTWCNGRCSWCKITNQCQAKEEKCQATTPVDGNWGSWSKFTECSVKCDGGTQRRTRACDAPTAKDGGKTCTGSATEDRKCNTQKCTEYPHILYVDALTGTNNKSCGKNQSSPCKDLSVGIQRVQDPGTVIIAGKQHLNDTIFIDKDINITTVVFHQGMITSNGTVDFAFTINCWKPILVGLSNLQFQNIGVLKRDDPTCYRMKKDTSSSSRTSIVRLDHINVTNTPRREETIRHTPNSYGTLKITYIMKILNSVFSNTNGIIFIDTDELILQNCTFLNHKGNKLGNMGVVRIIESSIALIETCRFINALSSIFVELNRINEATITGCSFFNLSIHQGSAGCVGITSSNLVTIEESTFIKCNGDKGGAVSITSSKKAGGSRMRKCLFKDNAAKTYGGALFVDTKSKSPKDAALDIEDSLFLNNTAGKLGQAIYCFDVTRRIKNVKINASSDTPADHVNIVGEVIDLKKINIKLRNSAAIRNSMIKNVITIKAYRSVHLFDEVDISCPRDFNVVHDREIGEGVRSDGIRMWRKAKTVTFQGRCESCRSDKYTLRAGKLNIQEKRNEYYNEGYQAVNVTNGQCLQCPLGAICDGDIKPLDNYWGVPFSNDSLLFTRCPNDFCCSRQTVPCTSYDTCNTGRSGVLCGSCDVGYSQSFVSDGCVLKSGVSCDILVFVFYFIGVSLAFTIVFTYLPCIIQFVKNILESRKKLHESEVAENGKCSSVSAETEASAEKLNDEGPDDDTETGVQENEENFGEIVVHTRKSNGNQKYGISADEPLPLSAYVTLVSFFFQVTSLVRVKLQAQNDSQENAMDSTSSDSDFLQFVFNCFNFRLVAYRKVCPMNDLTLPTKEFISVGLKVCSVFNLVLFYLAWKCFVLIRMKCFSANRKESGSQELAGGETKENEKVMINQVPDDEIQDCTRILSFASITKIGFVKLVKLNFTSISLFAFHMVHCVTINGNLHLFMYGDLQCYNLWQQIILFAVLPMILLFPLSFGISLDLLKDGYISTSTFLFSLAMPLFTLGLYAKKKFSGIGKCTYSKEEEICVTEILAMEEELFRDDGSTFRWPIVQLYRNLLVAALSTFIINPIYKSLMLCPVFLMFSIHDRDGMPYKNNYLNYLQMLSSACLLVINACDSPAAISTTFDLMGIPGVEGVLTALKYIELVMLAVVPLSLVAWKMIKFCKEKQQ